jgi:acid phosphatase type 7
MHPSDFRMTRTSTSTALAAALAAAACASPAAAHVGAHNEFESLRPETIQVAPQWLQDATNCSIAVPEPANRTISSGGVVTVTWNCTSLPPGAWIGAYSPPPADLDALRNSYPVRMTQNLDTWAGTPSGSVRMRFGNYRLPLQFFMMAGGNYYQAPCCPLYITNSSTLVAFADPNEPVRPRLMVVGDAPDQAKNLRVMWGSYNASARTASAQFSLQPNYVNTTNDGYFVGWASQVTRVTRDQLFNAPANGSGFTDLGNVHWVDVDLNDYLTAAERNRTLYFRVGDANRGAWLADVPFVIPPPPGAPTVFNPLTGGGQPMTLAIFGDYGRGSADDSETWVEYGRPAINTTARLRELAGLAGNVGAAATLGGRTASAVWVIGDLSYANGVLTVWDSYLDMTAQFAGSLPMISLLGNHELNSPGDAGNTFFNPNTDNGGGGEGGVLA